MTVESAAKLLGLSDNAIRKRIERGSLESELVGGTRYVLFDADMPQPDNGMTQHAADMSAEAHTLLSELRSRIEFLEGELEEHKQEMRLVRESHTEESRRKDHLLAAAIERIPPQLEEAPSEAPGAPQSASGSPDGEMSPERPWWRRMFRG
jgi:excisionase family DNA binding protein